MTTAHTYHPPHLIDIAPLAARYEFMTQAILAFIAAGHMGLVLRELNPHKATPKPQFFQPLTRKITNYILGLRFGGMFLS